jgi:LacI family transcriptional regulator
MTTIREVAQRAGVSTSTVSHFLNRSKKVSSDLETRIASAMRELGYRQPHTVARSLRSGQTGSIGVVLDDIGGARHNQVLRGVSASLNEAGLGLMLRSSGGDWSREAEHIENLIDYQVDGIIVSSGGGAHQGFERLQRCGIPAVAVANPPRSIAPAGGLLGIVSFDAAPGAAAVVRHLLEMGRRAIAFIGPESDGLLDHSLREGFRAALEDAGRPVNEDAVVFGPNSTEAGRHSLFRALRVRPRPDAIFVTDPRLLIGALNGLFDLGLSVPEEVSVVAFGDLDWAEAIQPALTVLSVDEYQLGRESVRLLLEVMNGRDAARVVLLPTQLVLRDSVSRGSG